MAARDDLVQVYRAAFAAPPYVKVEAEVEEFSRWLPRHLAYEDFRVVAAFQGEQAEMVGFAYGFRNNPGQYWHQEVAKVVSTDMVVKWLAGSFRLAEIAVTPLAQGMGIGGRLHDLLLAGLSHKRATLSTIAYNTPAYHMYRGRGWELLLDDFRPTGVDRRYRIMGLELGEGS